MASVGDLIVKLKADAKGLTEGLNKANADMKKTGEGFKKAGKKMSLVASGPVAALGTGMILSAANFEKSMNRVAALTGATGRDFDALNQQAKDLGASTMFSASQSAEAMGFLAMAGFKTNDIMGAMPGVLDLAAASQIDLADAADIASNILTGYSKSTEELAHVNDVLVKAMTSANVDLTMLGESMKYAGPVASAAGVAFEEAAAAVALMGNAGIQGSMAGTALRGAITRMLTPSDEAAAVMQKLGVNAVDSQGNLLGLTDIVAQLETAGASTAEMMTIFGQRAGPAMMALVSQGSDALAGMTTELENSGGTAKSIADTQMQGLAGATTELKSAWEGMSIALGEVVLPALTGLVDVLTPLIQGFSKLPGPVKLIIVGLMAAVVVLGPLLILIGFMIPAITGLATVFGALSLSMGPVTITILAIAAAVAGIIIIWKNWDKIVEVSKKLWEKISNTWKKTWSWLTDGIGNALENLQQKWDSIWKGAKDLVSMIFRRIQSLFESKLGWLLPGGAFIKALLFLKENWDDIWGGMTSVVETVVTSLKGPINSIIRFVNKLIDGLNKISFDIPNIPGVPGRGTTFGINIPNIPELAKGGIVRRPTLAMIGEAGPEAVIPLSKGGGAGGSITINIMGPTYGMDDFEDRVAKAVRDGVRRGGFQGILRTG